MREKMAEIITQAHLGGKVKLGFVFAWYDLWIGFYYNREKKRLYIMIPFIGIWIQKEGK